MFILFTLFIFYVTLLKVTKEEFFMIRYIFFILGSLSLVLAVLGIVLPIVPTTPLLLLACYLYGKSSERFCDWLTSTAFYNKYAKDFVDNRSLTLNRKILLLSLASTMLLFPLIILPLMLKLVIICTYLFLYYYFIFKIKTI